MHQYVKNTKKYLHSKNNQKILIDIDMVNIDLCFESLFITRWEADAIIGMWHKNREDYDDVSDEIFDESSLNIWKSLLMIILG